MPAVPVGNGVSFSRTDDGDVRLEIRNTDPKEELVSCHTISAERWHAVVAAMAAPTAPPQGTGALLPQG